MRFHEGQEVYVLYKKLNKDGSYKWRHTNKKLEINRVMHKKYYFYVFPYKAGKKDVCSTQKGAEHVCKTRNQQIHKQKNKME